MAEEGFLSVWGSVGQVQIPDEPDSGPDFVALATHRAVVLTVDRRVVDRTDDAGLRKVVVDGHVVVVRCHAVQYREGV